MTDNMCSAAVRTWHCTDCQSMFHERRAAVHHEQIGCSHHGRGEAASLSDPGEYLASCMLPSNSMCEGGRGQRRLVALGIARNCMSEECILGRCHDVQGDAKQPSLMHGSPIWPRTWHISPGHCVAATQGGHDSRKGHGAVLSVAQGSARAGHHSPSIKCIWKHHDDDYVRIVGLIYFAHCCRKP